MCCPRRRCHRKFHSESSILPILDDDILHAAAAALASSDVQSLDLSASPHRIPPIQRQALPRHEARRVGGQVGGGLADLLRLAGARDGVHGAARAHGRFRVRLLGGDPRARSVSMKPGAMAFTRTPLSAKSSAIARTIPIIPALGPAGIDDAAPLLFSRGCSSRHEIGAADAENKRDLSGRRASPFGH